MLLVVLVLVVFNVKIQPYSSRRVLVQKKSTEEKKKKRRSYP